MKSTSLQNKPSKEGLLTERYLLFDGECAVCTSLARNIERETNGWLVAHSLRDPAIQRTLARARPEMEMGTDLARNRA